MRRRLRLAGAVVVITGGAQGIGRATAAAVAARGATVAILDRDGEAAALAARELGGDALGLTADVTDPAALADAIATVVERRGRIDVLIANAGIGPRSITVDEGDPDHARQVLDVNLTGVWSTLRAGVGPVAAQRGHVLVISSAAAFVVTPTWAAYGVSKAGVEMLARSLRIELAPSGTTVGVAHFGLVDTGLVDRFAADPLYAHAERLIPGFVATRVAPRTVAERVADGIERRAARTIVPGWLGPVYALRGLLGPLSDALLVRSRRAHSYVDAVRERDREQAAQARTSPISSSSSGR
ncbi:SDR family NAD(P)-dependent oxidoreductase [Patulibacter defluvii]|uniref:SDR family NAD(P)-dependent oxidoreductase n=1 Tax=Patulibacter defluvii TaxID=3095358 RepID=UPI002A760BD2|nr:SDR family NAD(P)-dependent oxidoreductase [Patulibacter sp. DM4]